MDNHLTCKGSLMWYGAISGLAKAKPKGERGKNMGTIADLENDIESLGVEVETLQDEVAALKDRDSQLTTIIRELTTRVENLEAGKAPVAPKVEGTWNHEILPDWGRLIEQIASLAGMDNASCLGVPYNKSQLREIVWTLRLVDNDFHAGWKIPFIQFLRDKAKGKLKLLEAKELVDKLVKEN